MQVGTLPNPPPKPPCNRPLHPLSFLHHHRDRAPGVGWSPSVDSLRGSALARATTAYWHLTGLQLTIKAPLTLNRGAPNETATSRSGGTEEEEAGENRRDSTEPECRGKRMWQSPEAEDRRRSRVDNCGSGGRTDAIGAGGNPGSAADG
ncbi:hypothetical protein NL676_013909 [Syzygium grande]|nr:hypothetical protein NL676_013909 [Syzygium grande]